MTEGRRDVRVPVAGAAETREVATAFNAMVADVERVEDGLRELDGLKSRFVSSVSHELRTPLTSIRGYLEMLLDGEEGELTPDQHAAVEVAHRNALRLNALIADLLLLARMEAGRHVLERVEVALDAVAERAEAELLPAARARAIRIDRQVDEAAVAVGDPRALEQVVANLLSNAVKFSPDGGTVRLEAARENGHVRVEVADEGVGIPREELARIGERFFRARTAAGVEGTGLGLAITRELIDRLGGRLEIDSAEGVGSTFRVVLPAAGR
jgi:signal transduction histidine kinase